MLDQWLSPSLSFELALPSYDYLLRNDRVAEEVPAEGDRQESNLAFVSVLT
jgi:hypothetical protein